MVTTTSNAFTELSPLITGSATLDTVSGTISFTDVDLTDRPVASAAFTSFTYTDALLNPLTLNAAQLADVAAVEATVSVVAAATNTNNGSATWTYSLADSNFDFLAAGEILTLTYTATVNDGHGGVVSKPFTVTITGTDDAPVVTTTSNAFTELSPLITGSATLDTVSGTISFTDVDLTDRPVASAAFTSFTYTDALLNPLTLNAAQLADVAAVEATVSVVAAATNTNNGSATWTYSLADSNFDFLAAGEILTLTYTATVNDGHGGVVSKPFTVTITGTDDAPVVTTTSNAFTELSPLITGSATLDTVSGTISFTDVDLTDRPVASAAFTSFTYTDALLNPLTLNAAQLADVAAVEATVSVVAAATNTNNGSATWTYSLADSNFDFLAAGEILTLTYTATVNDGHGGVVSKPFTVTITGTDDAPVVTTTSNAFTELSPLITGSATLDTVSGTISFTDVDLTDRPVASAAFTSFTYTDALLNPLTLNAAQLADVAAVEATVSVVAAATNTNNGSATWTYSLADSNFDFLAAGEILTLTYTATVNDGHGGVVSKPFTVTITGTDDAPVVTTTSNAFTELSPLITGSATLDTVSGTISFTDVDLTDRPVASAAFTSFTYTDALLNPLTLNAAQLADVAAVEATVSGWRRPPIPTTARPPGPTAWPTAILTSWRRARS